MRGALGYAALSCALGLASSKPFWWSGNVARWTPAQETPVFQPLLGMNIEPPAPTPAPHVERDDLHARDPSQNTCAYISGVKGQSEHAAERRRRSANNPTQNRHSGAPHRPIACTTRTTPISAAATTPRRSARSGPRATTRRRTPASPQTTASRCGGMFASASYPQTVNANEMQRQRILSSLSYPHVLRRRLFRLHFTGLRCRCRDRQSLVHARAHERKFVKPFIDELELELHLQL